MKDLFCLGFCVFLSLAVCSSALAGEKNLTFSEKTPTISSATQKTTPQSTPVQKTTTVADSPVQKTTPMSSPVQKTTTFADSPVQKAVPMSSPVQKAVPMSSPVQKTTTFADSPVQKGVSMSAANVEVPPELLEALARLQPQQCEPLRNVGRAIARNAIKRKIANYIQSNLPALPLP